jgi:uncharacterized RDD family membrane protein YckC
MADGTSQDRSYGGFWARFLAYLVDSVVVFTLIVLLVPVVALLGESGARLFGLACGLVPILYWALMHASARQATLGKSLLGMKVATLDGNRLSIGRSLGRELAKILSGLTLMIGYLLAAFTGRKQALHDFVASTVVLREGPSHTLVALLLGVFGWLAPVAVLMFVGVGALIAMMGVMGGQMMQQAMQEQAKQQQAMQQQAMRAPPRPAPAVPKAPPAPPKVEPAKVEPVKVEPVAVEPAKAEPPPAPVVRAVAMAPKAPPVPVKAAAPAKLAPRAEPKSAPSLRYNDLVSAVMHGDAAGVDELLRFGKWVDKPDSHGQTPLVVAVRMRDPATAEVLLKAGADPGRAVRAAVEQGDQTMLALLERYGARRP